MKPWKPCEHCYLRDKHCENAEREQPCIPVQEYLESSSKIKRLQNLLDVSENEHYKTIQQLAIATKALQYYAEGTLGSSVARQALKEIDLVGTSVSLTKEEQ